MRQGPGRPSAGGPRMDRRAVTSPGVVKISHLASRLRTTAHIENQWNTEMIFHNWGLVFVSSVNKDFSSESRLYFYWIDMKYLRQISSDDSLQLPRQCD